MIKYDDLKREIPMIAKLVGDFPAEIRSSAFEILIRHFVGESPEPGFRGAPGTTAQRAPKEGVAAVARAAGKTPKRESTRESYQIDRELDLRGDGSRPSFKAFCSQKKPRTAAEFNAVAVYYLKKVLQVKTATLNHAFTCYSEVHRRPPEHFRQSFHDTKNRAGWVEFDADGNLQIPHRGTVFVEHDLPHSDKDKEDTAE